MVRIIKKIKPTPVIHIFKEVNVGKYKYTKHYDIVEVINGRNQLSNKLNISADRNCAKANPDYWVQIRKGNKWLTPRLTGLFKTPRFNTFYGDTQRKRNLVIFEFSNDKRMLKVSYYPKFYTQDFSWLNK